MQNPEGDSSIKCMIIPGISSDAVCRECLAMHSKWFAVRSYLLSYVSRRHSAEVLVFPSDYASSDVVTNCRKKLCLNVFSWDLSDCQVMDSIFSRHRKLLEVHQKTCGLNGEHQICNENTMDLNRIRQVLDVIALERMHRASRSSEPLHAPFAFSNTLKMLRTKETLCINTTLRRDKKWKCIECILKDAGGARLVIVSSLRYAMILTSDIKRRLECSMCGNTILEDSGRCHQYRDESVVNIETYPKPSDNEVLDERMNNCIVFLLRVGSSSPLSSINEKCFFNNKSPLCPH